VQPAKPVFPHTADSSSEEHGRPRDELPTLPQLQEPIENNLWEDQLTVPDSVAPVEAPTIEQRDAALPSDSVWSHIWSRRGFLGTAAGVAFCSALALGRLKAAQPLPPVTIYSPRVTTNGAAAAPVDPVPAPEQMSPAIDAEATAPATPPSTDTVKPTEAPAVRAAHGTKMHNRSVVRAVTPAPRKRFRPSEI